MALTICTFLWGNKYSLQDVLRLRAGLKRHLKAPHRFILLTEPKRRIEFPPWIGQPPYIERHDIEDLVLIERKGCFVRLRLFDPEWQQRKNIKGKVVCLDLDMVITGRLDRIFDREESFVILKGANAANPCPYNGSVWMFEAGTHSRLWTEFSLEKAGKINFYEFPDDQGWFWHMLPNAATWQCGLSSGIYAFQKPGWGNANSLPPDARMVVFPGWRSPRQFLHLPWIKEHCE